MAVTRPGLAAFNDSDEEHARQDLRTWLDARSLLALLEPTRGVVGVRGFVGSSASAFSSSSTSSPSVSASAAFASSASTITNELPSCVDTALAASPAAAATPRRRPAAAAPGRSTTRANS